MTSILLTQEAFDELMDNIVPTWGVEYLLSSADSRYIEGIGEVEYVEVMRRTSEVVPPVPFDDVSPLDRLDDFEGCPDCGDLDGTLEWCANCDLECDCGDCEG
jgi:hypothetical protein